MKRAIFTSTLAITLLSLCVYYQASYEEHREYPGVRQITLDYQRYTGSEVSVSGEVIAVDKDGFVLSTKHNGRNTLFKVHHNSSNIETGDQISIIGILESNYTITSKELLVSKKWNYYFVFIRSIIALPLLLYLFLKNWQFDLERKLFRRR